MLGLEAPDRTPPEIAVSAAAAAVIANAVQANPGAAVHLSIDGRWQHSFNLGPVKGTRFGPSRTESRCCST